MANLDNSGQPTLVASDDYWDREIGTTNISELSRPSENLESQKVEVKVDLPISFPAIPSSYPAEELVGSDSKITNDELITQNPQLMTVSPDTIERLSYYHRDGLDSIVGRSNFTINYDTNLVPTISATIKLTDSYNAYGINNRGNLPLYPKSDGFDEWSNRTYSQKEYDYESQSYYYGSRYYNPNNGQWDKADVYRGTLNNPISRNRYNFVTDNPVNNIDLYGFAPCAIGYIDAGTSCLAGGIPNKVIKIENYNTTTLQNEINSLNSTLIQLEQKANSDWWSTHFASVEMNNYVGMTGIIGRLERRGYDLDYRTVYGYLNSKAIEKQQLYNSQLAVYANTIAVINNTNSNITSLYTTINLINQNTKNNPNVLSLSQSQIANFSNYINTLRNTKDERSDIQKIYDDLRYWDSLPLEKRTTYVGLAGIIILTFGTGAKDTKNILTTIQNEPVATDPVGGKGSYLIRIADGTNKASYIGDRIFSGHALDNMQSQGIFPMVVQNVIRNGIEIIGKEPGTMAYYDKVNNITVIIDKTTKNVITVDYGFIKQ